VEKSESIVVEILPVEGKPATPVEPGDAALDNPALGFHDEAFELASTDVVEIRRAPVWRVSGWRWPSDLSAKAELRHFNYGREMDR
jgi:hypothetical protein